MKKINGLLGILVSTVILTGMGQMMIQAQESPGEQKIDLTKVSCRELLKMPGEDKDATLIFYHGLMTAKKNQMMITRNELREATDKITEYCIDNPDAMLMTAFEENR